MRSFRNFLSLALCALMLFGVGTAVQAQSTTDECMERIVLIENDLTSIFQAGGITGNNSVQTFNSLFSKLDSAATKLEQQKPSDALRKLTDFQTAVLALSGGSKPKLSASDAEVLLNGNGASALDEGINGAIACVALLP